MCAPRERHGESVFFVTSRCCFCLVLPNRTRREGRHHCLFLSCRWGVRPPSCLWGVILYFSNRCDWVCRVVQSVVSPIMWVLVLKICFPSCGWGVVPSCGVSPMGVLVKKWVPSCGWGVVRMCVPILWMGCGTVCFPSYRWGVGTKIVFPILWMGCSTKWCFPNGGIGTKVVPILWMGVVPRVMFPIQWMGCCPNVCSHLVGCLVLSVCFPSQIWWMGCSTSDVSQPVDGGCFQVCVPTLWLGWYQVLFFVVVFHHIDKGPCQMCFQW